MEKQDQRFERGWHGGEGVCGGGSDAVYSIPDSNSVMAFVEGLKKQGKLPTKPIINEAGCGDMHWMRYNYGYFMHAMDYHGYDITDRDGELYNHFPFEVKDITTEVMRSCNLVICRLVFIHLPNERIAAALSNFRAAGAKYLIADFCGDDNNNRQTQPTYEAKLYNLRVEPFNLQVLDEDPFNKRMALYAL